MQYARRPLVPTLALTLTALLALPAAGAIISANPNTIGVPVTPPMQAVAQLATTDANAYHVNSLTAVNRVLAYSNFNKPKILSDDADGVTAADAIAWINLTCAGGEHYEHFDAALGPKAMKGQLIDDWTDFPDASQSVLNHIQSSSCVSTLAPWGTLTQVGTEFRWNNQPVTLIGHSWMGALAGLNFDIEGYLDVLASKKVNLTRVWVVEQWTAYQASKAGFTAYPGNAVMPFTGELTATNIEDKIDPLTINPDFLNRLETFVDEAWERGIVVQLTLFDRHGVKNSGLEGEWPWSPYNRDNNQHLSLAPEEVGTAPTSFLSTSCLFFKTFPPSYTAGCYHMNLIDAIVQRLQGKGNVVYEIMNEPRDNVAGEWSPQQVLDFHAWVAQEILNQ